MITGLEIPIITALSGKLAAAIQANRTSVLVEETKSILNDEKLTNLLCLLYKLDPKLAKRNDKRYAKARAICDNLELLKGSKYILIRHISARSANALALQYSDHVTADTTDAKIRQSREKAHMREQMIDKISEDRLPIPFNTITLPLRTPHLDTLFKLPVWLHSHIIRILQTILPSSPVRKAQGPYCQMASSTEPSHITIRIEHPQPPHTMASISAITKDENSSTSQTDLEEDDLIPVIEIRDKPKSSRRGSAQRFSHSHVRRRSTDSEEIVENIRSGLQDIAETAHYIDNFRASNESNDDVSSITSGTSYMSFDDTDTEGGSIFDSGLDDF
ncbi:hypothetical protein HHX47_DHR5000437 [Lentinula edodes]|nr:hypothetical protein HHX47_DHR5000437 [Lentinula edodes]